MFSGNKKYFVIFILLAVWAGIILGLEYHRGQGISEGEEGKEPESTALLIPPQFAEDRTFVFEEVPLENSFGDTHEFIDDAEEFPCGEFRCFTSQEFVSFYDALEQNQPLDFGSKYIYNVPEVDEYIKQIAEERGYRGRGFAREQDLVSFENVQTRPEVRDAYVAMRNKMKEEGAGNLHFVSGYRSSERQRTIFLGKMAGVNSLEIPSGAHDALLQSILDTSSIPAYSKHHSGYAADFGCGNDALVYEFAQTGCYRWLSSNNFENAKRYGFIPSYPEGAENQGPLPEPWEFVWVGKENLIRDNEMTGF